MRRSVFFVTAVSLLILVGCAANPAPTQPGQSAPSSPAPTLTFDSFVVTPQEISIPAGLDASQAGSKIMNSLTTVVNSSTDPTLIDFVRQEGTNWDVLLPKLMDSNGKVATNTLLVSNWESVDELKNHFMPTIMNSMNMVTKQYVNTAWNGDTTPENVEPYRLWFDVVSSSEEAASPGSGADIAIVVTFTNQDNSDMNTADDSLPNAPVTYVFDLKRDGETERIADVTTR